MSTNKINKVGFGAGSRTELIWVVGQTLQSNDFSEDRQIKWV